MHLSTKQTKTLQRIITLLAEATDGDALRESLGLPMLDLLECDQYVSMVWSERDQRFERFSALNMSPGSLRHWDSYYRFIDPLTFPMMRLRQPTLATQILTSRDLHQSEFFNDFLRPEQMHWGVNVYFFDKNFCVGDMRIWRRQQRGNLDPNSLDLLRMVEPAITGALGRLHWNQEMAPPASETEHAEDILQRSSHLSRREAEIAWLVTHGCPDKEISRRLNVSCPTVRFHLTNAFRKIQVENRAELAARVQLLMEAYKANNGRTAVN
jgi:DNA-binding CsgD family transcriptional regulator